MWLICMIVFSYLVKLLTSFCQLCYLFANIVSYITVMLLRFYVCCIAVAVWKGFKMGKLCLVRQKVKSSIFGYVDISISHKKLILEVRWPWYISVYTFFTIEADEHQILSTEDIPGGHILNVAETGSEILSDTPVSISGETSLTTDLVTHGEGDVIQFLLPTSVDEVCV